MSAAAGEGPPDDAVVGFLMLVAAVVVVFVGVLAALQGCSTERPGVAKVGEFGHVDRWHDTDLGMVCYAHGWDAPRAVSCYRPLPPECP